MSKKTIKQRIAMVAVSALMTGTFTVISGSTAFALNEPLANKLEIYPSVAGPAVLATVNADRTVATNGASSGLLSAVSGSGTTQTATLIATGTLAVSAGAPTTGTAAIVVNGGTITKALHTATTAAFIVPGGSYAVAASQAAPTYTAVPNEELGALITPNAGAATMTVQYYSGSSVTASTPTSGTLVGQITVTIATTNAVGAVSASKSTAYYSATSGGTADVTTDATAANYAKGNGSEIWGTIHLKDAYSNNVVAGGTLIAEITGGAKVNLSGDASPSTVGTSVTAIDFEAVDENDGLYYFAVAQGTANAASTFSLTIKHSNGTVIATKSGKILGEVATFTVSDDDIALVGGGAAEDSITVSFKDAAGNTVYPTSATHPVTEVSGLVNAIVTDVSVDEYPTPTTTGYGTITCGSLSASTKMQLQMTLPNGATVKSNEFTVRCAGAGYTYSASFDKASYTPGSVATLTITVKDEDGNAASDYTYLSSLTATASTATADKVSVVGGPSATYVTDPSLTDLTEDGVITYKWVVGSTTGDFNAVVKVPAINAANSKQTSVTVPYSIKVANAGTTNEDVLKSIVALIASINKQIQALQKLILKR